MERHAQEGSSGRWYVREGYKVVAGPYEEALAKRLVATWNRRQARQAQQELPAAMPVVRSTAPARQATRVARRRAQEAARRPEEAPRWAQEVVAGSEAQMPVSPWAQVLSAVPEAHRAVVGLHANLILNTSGGMRPSDAARQAVAAYERMGFEAFEEAHRAQSHSATAACARSGCSGCQSSLERSRRPR